MSTGLDNLQAIDNVLRLNEVIMKWIKVEDRLPEVDTMVVFVGYHDVQEGGLIGFGDIEKDCNEFRFVDLTNTDNCGECVRVFDVTHWAELTLPE